MDYKNFYWWGDHFYCKGEDYQVFWKDYLGNGEQSILFIMGKGFDPRMNLGIKSIIKLLSQDRFQCKLLTFHEGEASPSQQYQELVQLNYIELTEIVPEDRLQQVNVQLVNQGRRIEGRSAVKIFRDNIIIDTFTDIIIDISALPRSIYFPMLAHLIDLNKIAKPKKNIHVLVAESAQIDSCIMEQELDEKANYMFSLTGEMNATAALGKPIAWFPVLGNDKENHLARIYELLKATGVSGENVDIETCPILPFPSSDPQKTDKLIAEYHSFLLDTAGVEARNLIYADEQNPFDVYKQIRQAGIKYDKALYNIGGCRKVVSAISSKLMSIGALLAAYEGNMAISYVGAQGYRINNIMDTQDVELFELWLDGEPYESN